MDYEATLFAVFLVVAILLVSVINRKVKQAQFEKEIQAKVEYYLQNMSKFVTLEEVDDANGKMLLAYNYLTHEYVAQGKTEDEVKINIAKVWPGFDVFVVKLEDQIV